jgi:hypothetical protein
VTSVHLFAVALQRYHAPLSMGPRSLVSLLRAPPWRRVARAALLVLGFAVVFGPYLGLGNLYRLRGEMNADEGFYVLAARAVMEGQLPYRDFGYTQMPLLPYLNGALMSGVGFGLDAQRSINLAWGALGLLAIVLVVRLRVGRWEPAFLAGFAGALAPHYVANQALGKTHGAAGFFLAAAFAAVYLRGPVVGRALGFALAGTLAAGTRLSLALPVGLAALALLVEARPSRQRVLVLAVLVAVPAMLLLPFYFAAPEAFLFFNWKYHLESQLARRLLGQAVEWWQTAPASLILAAMGLSGAALLVRKRLWTEGILLLAALAGSTVPMVMKSAYGDYALPSVVLAGAAGLVAMWAACDMERFAFRHFAWALPWLTFLHPLPTVCADGEGGMVHLAHNVASALRRPLTADQRAAGWSAAAGRFVREHVPAGPLLAVIPIVAVEAGRPVMAGTEMGQFSVMEQREGPRAERLRLVTLVGLTEMVRRSEPAAIVKLVGRSVWNFEWMVPSLRCHSEELRDAFYKAIDESYARAFLVGNIEVLTRRPRTGAPIAIAGGAG